MSFAARSQPAEVDDDAARMAMSEQTVLRLTIAALGRVTMLPGHPDKARLRALARIDLGRIDDAQIATMRRLAWRYRRQMPRHLAPRMNPDDPIVLALAARETESTHRGQ